LRNDRLQREERDTIAERAEACAMLIQQARAIVKADGANAAGLDKISTLLVRSANRARRCSQGDFVIPDGQARHNFLTLEGEDGMGLHLTIVLPGKEAAVLPA
jgi:hypothetical protein